MKIRVILEIEANDEGWREHYGEAPTVEGLEAHLADAIEADERGIGCANWSYEVVAD